MNAVIDLLNSHRSIRKFTPDAVDQDNINSLIAGRPGRCNLQLYPGLQRDSGE